MVTSLAVHRLDDSGSNPASEYRESVEATCNRKVCNNPRCTYFGVFLSDQHRIRYIHSKQQRQILRLVLKSVTSIHF